MLLSPHSNLSKSIPLFAQRSLGSWLLKHLLPIDGPGHKQASGNGIAGFLGRCSPASVGLDRS
eukprot:1949808-Alexandrium_andersonii.AAC.1